ncbi:MAG: SPOR domain-containing protein [Bryobacteraceae bacterium]|nr:SPOR domain-containing protein [Bryobacteraceae bacterium]
MPAREDGEYELILGNKQLLGVLFIVIVLLGVFFAMGFLAGRSTSSTVATAPAGGPGSQLKTIDPPMEPKKAAAATKSSTLPPVVEEKPVPAPAQPKPEPAKTPALPEVKPTAPVITPAPAQTAKVETAGPVSEIRQPPPGSYLQVAATTAKDAQGMLATLRKQGHQATLAPVPDRPELVRIIVGPLATKEATAEAREKLRELGIDNPVPRSYK